MRPQTDIRNARQRGFTLTEILVAIAIFSIVMVAALVMYDRNSRVFKSGVENADAQQNTRVAFDKLVADLRMAGYDYDRDGLPTTVPTVWIANTPYNPGAVVYPPTANGFAYIAIAGGVSAGSQPSWSTTVGDVVPDGPTLRWQTAASGNQFQQPDEQIEYAGPGAITIRGNFDFETDPVNENGREAAYQSAQFPVVTTANDEIVTYALVSKNSAANTSTIPFYVDINAPGAAPSRTAYPSGNAERLVTITGVDTTNANPPYTLFRMTFDDRGNLVRTPLADNIRSMTFRYYQDAQGVQVLQNLANVNVPDGTGILGQGQFDPDTPSALVPERVVRSRIKSIRLTLTGMTENPDPEYEDTTDLASLTNYRKYRLESLITPRNIGKRGLREQDTHPPGAPILDSIALGHCGIVQVKWSAPISGGAIEAYAILYDTDLVDGFANTQSVGLTFEYPLMLPPDKIDQTWYFTVAAQNGFGTTVSNSAPLSGIPLNRTKPQAITDFDVEPSATALNLSWKIPQFNVVGQDQLQEQPGGSPVPDPNGIPNAEIADGSTPIVRIYRGETADFAPIPPPAANTNAIWTETSTGANAPHVDFGTRVGLFADTGAAHCTDYFYRVQVLDRCAYDAAKNAGTPNGYSDIIPLPANDALGGQTLTTAPTEPKAPGELLIDNATSSCVGANCTVNLSWPKVVEDINNARVAIDAYEIDVQRYYWDDTTNKYVIDSASDAHQTLQETGFSFNPDTNATYAVTNLPQVPGVGGVNYQYEFKVRALSCAVESDDSPARRWPCAFSGGAPIISADAIDGVGSAANPWLVFTGPTISVSGLGGNVTIVNGTLLKQGITIEAWSESGPFLSGSSTHTLPDLDDDEVPYQLLISVSDNAQCTLTTARYLVGSATACCLQPQGPDNLIVNFSAGNNYVDVTMTNQCDDPLFITAGGIKVKWNSAGLAGGTKVDYAGYPPLSGTTLVQHVLNTNNSPFTTSPPGTARPNIPANALLRAPSTTYVIGSAVRIPTSASFIYIATTDGTTAATAPTFPTTNGATVTDGTVVWVARPTPYTVRFAFSRPLPLNPIKDVCVTFTRGADAATMCKIVDLNPTPTANCD